MARLAVAGFPPPVPYVNSFDSRSRPGLVTAIGVLSIVVACISALCSLVLGVETAGLFMLSKMATAMSHTSTVTLANAGPNAVTTTVNLTPAIGTSTSGAFTFAAGPNELPEPQRSQVLAAFAEIQPLSDQQKLHLTKLLTEHGRQLFPDDGNALTAASIRAIVKEKSSERAIEGKVEGSSWYVIPAGRITLFDDRAVFASVDGTTSFTSIGQETIVPDAASSTTLTPQQVSSIIASAQTMVGGKLNSSQVATLQKELSAPNQQYVDPNLLSVSSVMPSADGTATITFTDSNFGGGGGMMQINAQGQIQASTAAAKSTAAGGWNRNPAFPWANLQIPTWKIALAIGEDVASFGLAIYLFVIGIVVMRQSLIGRRLHLIYAWLKLPLAVAGGIAMTWLYTTFLNIRPGAAMANPGIIYGALWMSLIACIYPIALIITLSTRSMREYYKPEPRT